MDQTNIIAIPEKRETVNEVKSKMGNLREKFKDFYQEKVVDTGISDGIDKAVAFKNKAMQVGVGALGTFATVALMIVPADGPLGEACTAICTPGLIALMKLCSNIEEKSINSVKGFVEKKIIGIDKNDDNVVVYNDKGEIMKDVMDVMSNIKDMDRSLSQGAA